MTNKALNIPNHVILPLVAWLSQEELQGSDSRNRTRFIKLLTPRSEEMEEERKKICEKYSETKKVDGKDVIVYTDKEGKDTVIASQETRYKIKDVEGFNKDYSAYMFETLVLDVSPATNEMIMCIKNVVLNTKTVFKGAQAANYDSWCEIFEAVK